MTDLHKKAFSGLLKLVAFLAIILFLPAWSIYYWQGWLFLFVFSGASLLITIYLMKNDPKLLERRVNAGPTAEKEHSQKLIQSLAACAFFTAIILPVFDYRFGWSVVPVYASIGGDVLVAASFLVVFFVFKANSFTSATIVAFSGQQIVSTGPYAWVRHPMYAGALIMFLGIAPALGSWWGLFAFIPFVLVIVLRLLDEEKFMGKNFPGYPDYQQKVKYRLVPFIW